MWITDGVHHDKTAAAPSLLALVQSSSRFSPRLLRSWHLRVSGMSIFCSFGSGAAGGT